MKLLLFLCFAFTLALQRSNCATVVVDGVTQWNNPTANIGDTIIFQHKDHYNLYIFRTKDAFNACNFTQATPLSNSNSSTYTWHPSRPGNFFFSFYNGTNKPCQNGQKLAIQVTALSSPSNPPALSPYTSPPATPGSGMISSSPAYPWPFQPKEKEGPNVGDISPAPGMALSPEKDGSVPFINSNPAVPLPTGEVDSATISPLATPANGAPMGVKVKGLMQVLMSLCCVIMVMQ